MSITDWKTFAFITLMTPRTHCKHGENLFEVEVQKTAYSIKSSFWTADLQEEKSNLVIYEAWKNFLSLHSGGFKQNTQILSVKFVQTYSMNTESEVGVHLGGNASRVSGHQIHLHTHTGGT